MIINLPYAALRAFEAVVRLKGFSAAADELGVSQSAISQHVKALEEWLGQELLIRGARRSTPTREGSELAHAVTDGLGRISDVCTRLRDRQRAENTIVISCLPGFAFIWLFPRLLHFDLAHPHLAISIATDMGSGPFTGAEADLAIRYGRGDNPGMVVEELMPERLFPVCTPQLAERLTCPADLAHHMFLEDETAQYGAGGPCWEFWAEQTGTPLPGNRRARRFGQTNMVVQAAIVGLGVALGREPMVLDALLDGRLVRPLPQITTSPLSYWLVRRAETQGSAKIEEFLAWITSEARNQPTLPAALTD